MQPTSHCPLVQLLSFYDARVHVISETLVNLRCLRVDCIVEGVPGPLEALVEVQAIHIGHEADLNNLQWKQRCCEV